MRLENSRTDLANFLYESGSHKSSLLNGLNELRLKEQLVDITFRIEKQKFRAHRAVLASCSDYFRAMFSHPLKEAELDEVELNGVPAEGFEVLLDFIYTTKLELNLLNIQEILLTASHIQLNSVTRECANYLEKQLDLENCLDVLHIAETYSLTKLEKLVYKFISANLDQFLGHYEIEIVFNRPRLIQLLSLNYPVNVPEKRVLDAVLLWWDKNNHNTTTLEMLIKNIDLKCVTPSDVDSLIAFRISPVNRTSTTVTLVQAQIEQRCNVISQRNSPKSPLINNRGMELALLTLGGFGIEGISNEICYFLPSKNKWYHLTTIPHVPQYSFGKAVLNNELYIIGGCYNNSTDLREYVHPFGFKYSPLWNKWDSISPMLMDRCLFSLNVVMDKIYAIGGVSDMQDEGDENFVAEIAVTGECYNPITDEWHMIRIPVENFPREQHAATSNGHNLYISGGLDKNSICLSTFYRFNVLKDTWEALPDLSQPRADHVMHCLVEGDILKIYVCGGYNTSLNMDNRELVDTIECFDTLKNTWEFVTRIPTPRFNAGITFDGQRIQIIGGYHPESIFNRKLVESFNLDEKRWSTDNYPRDVWECDCDTMYIPVCREDDEITA